ncbi:hypothetical protein EYC59_01170 [Candidatus Saccharibacteria bacterium]|nr:MAG: hypothetical protein EYC59_01170 [Candidatus Saccharibacteria bacterium]
MAKTVAFLYGLGEGNWHSRQFRQLLEASGYLVVQDPSKADILITHSGGSLLISPEYAARTVLVINHTYWPGRSLVSSHWRRQQHGLRTYGFRWARLTAMNCLYLFKLNHTIKLAKSWPRRAQTIPRADSLRLTFIRTQHDEFCDTVALLSS